MSGGGASTGAAGVEGAIGLLGDCGLLAASGCHWRRLACRRSIASASAGSAARCEAAGDALPCTDAPAGGADALSSDAVCDWPTCSARTTTLTISARTGAGRLANGIALVRSARRGARLSCCEAIVASADIKLRATVSLGNVAVIATPGAGTPAIRVICGSRFSEASPTSIASAGTGLDTISMSLSGQTPQGTSD